MAKFCKKCGTQLADEAIFCPNCGAAQTPAAPQPQPQPQVQPQQQVPQQQQPQFQPQQVPPQQPPKPQRSGPSIFNKEDIGFKGSDFPKNPIKEFISGDLSRFSIIVLFLAISAFFFSLLDFFGRGGSMRRAELALSNMGGFAAFRVIFMILVICSVVWLMFKMFIKKTTWFDTLVLAGTSALWCLLYLIETIVVCARARSGITFAAVLFFILALTAIAAGVLPLIIRIIRKNK